MKKLMKKTKKYMKKLLKKYDDTRKKDTSTKITQSVKKKDTPTKIPQSVRKIVIKDDIEDFDFDDKKNHILTNMV